MRHADAMTRLHHVVLFQLHPGTDVDDVVARLTALGEQPGVVSWRVERSLDERKGVVVLEDAVFASEEALEAFRVSDAHRAVTGHLSQCADWLVADHLVEEDAG